ncbi:MAG TPA: DNA-binding transcriptional regulator [Xanthomonadales bacterium]|nr:DNA-binding transcriptional regulator [Xanthomonadales bacterium]
MKRRSSTPRSDDSEALVGLARAFAALRSAEDVLAFLDDLCTPAERQALADRWRVVPLLLAGVTYRDIHDRTGVSVTTVGRVARCLAMGAGGYRTAARRLRLPGASHH